MFLSVLNEQERKIFGSMIVKIAEVDGEIAEEERELFDNFKTELQVDELDEMDLGLVEAIEILSKSSEVVKRSILLEVVSMVLSDETLSKEEKELVDTIANRFGLDNDKEKFYSSVRELQYLYGTLFDIVFVD
jgi:hypothetical protein